MITATVFLRETLDRTAAQPFTRRSRGSRFFFAKTGPAYKVVILLLAVLSLLILGAIFRSTIVATPSKKGWLTEECDKAVQRVENANIQLVAFDFDFTIIDIHTGGIWNGTADELAKHVRPEFKCYVARCLEKRLFVSITTFSTQKDLIASVLQKAILHPQASSIPIFGGEIFLESYGKGKQSQLHLSIDHFNKLPTTSFKAQVKPETTVLVDDDVRNIQVALKDGYHAIYYKPGSSIYQSTIVFNGE